MRSLRPNSVRALVITGIIAAALVAGAVIGSAHGGDDSKIHACVASPGGLARIVAPTEDCLPVETAVDWSVQGPQGIPGPQGPAGPPGPPGLSNVRTVFGLESIVAPGTSGDVFASCAGGERLLGGGYVQPFNNNQNAAALVNSPDPSNPTGRWFVRVFNFSAAAVRAKASVVCATVA